MDQQQSENISPTDRKKRVKRIKYFIILFIMLLILISISLNCFLFVKVMNLQHKIDELYSVNMNPFTCMNV